MTNTSPTITFAQLMIIVVFAFTTAILSLMAGHALATGERNAMIRTAKALGLAVMIGIPLAVISTSGPACRGTHPIPSQAYVP